MAITLTEHYLRNFESKLGLKTAVLAVSDILAVGSRFMSGAGVSIEIFSRNFSFYFPGVDCCERNRLQSLPKMIGDCSEFENFLIIVLRVNFLRGK